MPKYGRGLNREIVEAVNRGEMSEPFGIRDVERIRPPERLECAR